VSFLTEVASTPCGLFALAQDGSVLRDLLTTLFQPSHVSWEDPDFRRIVSLITAESQGVTVLAEESDRILARPLCNLWNEYEDPMALITGSEEKQIEATQHFINIIYTFVLNLQGEFLNFLLNFHKMYRLIFAHTCTFSALHMHTHPCVHICPHFISLCLSVCLSLFPWL
jgi:hypothetical protein